MPAGRREVGERLRVFTRNAGLKVTTGCVIEAHGEQLFMGNTMRRNFTVPANTRISFYTPHGAPQGYHRRTGDVANNPGQTYQFTDALDHIANGAPVVIDTYTAGMSCPNYNLTKLQRTDGRLTNYLNYRNNMTYDDIIKFLDDRPNAMDVVTIRNRQFSSDMTLLGVITELRTHNYAYDVYHCSFCRNAAYYQCGAPAAVVP